MVWLALWMLMAAVVLPFLAIMAARVRRSGVRLHRPTPGRVAVIAALLALCGLVLDGPSEGFMVVLSITAFLLFAWAWVLEFVTLMGMSDEAFPGRFDKLVWVAVLVLLPPVGVIAFGVFRRAYWVPEKPSADVTMRELA